MRLGGVCGIERRCFEDLFGDVGDGRTVEYVTLVHLSQPRVGGHERWETAHPAGVWVEESPEDAVFQHVLHLPAAVQEDGQHALP